jgi:signal transduction histidine kinase
VKKRTEVPPKKRASVKKEIDRRIEHAGKALHDEIGPLLSAAGLRLQLLKMDFPETAGSVREITQTLDEAIDRVRALSRQLNPSPFSLKPAAVKRPRNSKREYN